MMRWPAMLVVILLAALVAGCGGAPAGGGAASGAVNVGAKSAPPERSTAYKIASQQRADGDGRKRVQAKVVLNAGLESDSDKAIEAIRAAIQELLPADGEIEAVEVLVYKTEAETSGAWTLGHAFATKDGKGWTGNGRFANGNDRNNIELDLKLPAGEEHFSLAR